VTATPRIARVRPLTAVRPSRQSAPTITARTAGLIPARSGASAGNVPKRTYAQAKAVVTMAAGMQKHVPPTRSPAQPARR